MKTMGYGEEGRGAQRSPRPLERQLEDTDTRSASRLEVWGDMGRYGEIWGDMGRYKNTRLASRRPGTCPPRP